MRFQASQLKPFTLLLHLNSCFWTFALKLTAWKSTNIKPLGRGIHLLKHRNDILLTLKLLFCSAYFQAETLVHQHAQENAEQMPKT